MDDYISREAAIEALGEEPLVWTDSEAEIQERQDWEMHKTSIEAVPAADVRPVVLCRDCRYAYDSVGGWCCSHGVCVDCIVREDFFCADGEKRVECDKRGQPTGRC